MLTSDATTTILFSSSPPGGSPSAAGDGRSAQLPFAALPDASPGVTPTGAWAVLRALRSLRIIRAGQDEADLQEAIAGMLTRYSIPSRREHRFGPHCRADVWCDGVVIEVKKGRPDRASLIGQVTRYAQQPACREIIVVLERSVILPEVIEGKPVHVLSLNANWGVAL